jgi:DNA-binding MarR family transcriptional regulator
MTIPVRSKRSLRKKPGAPPQSGRPSAEADQRRALQASQFEHTGVLLWWASRAWLAEFKRRLNREGYGDLTEGAFQSLLPFLDIEGTRITELAERAGISKQAVNQFVDQLETAGIVERVADRTDGRAKVVRYAGRGLRFVRENQRIKRDLEAECEVALGSGGLSPLQESLRALIRALQTREPHK